MLENVMMPRVHFVALLHLIVVSLTIQQDIGCSERSINSSVE